MRHNRPFAVEVMVDFIDDALRADRVLTDRDIDGLMRTLAAAGVTRVAWAYYADERGGLLMPQGLCDRATNYDQCVRTYRSLGNPLRCAVEAGHRHGLEVYAYFKPYETGVSLVMPSGAPEALASGLLPHVGGQLGVLDPFVRDHPELRIQRRAEPEHLGPITTLQLIKRDAAPTRVTGERLQIWTSENNFRYTRLNVAFDCAAAVVPAAQDVRDHAGNVVTRAGDPVRVLTLTGLHIDSPYLLVTTDFADGPGDFANSGAAMLCALTADGTPIAGSCATGLGIWLASRVDFREWGLIYDTGRGHMPITLDLPNADGRSGFVAFARGKNPTLPAALCETEPAVQDFWMNCLHAITEAGVDGVDFREENHCTHTDEPEAYGHNDVVLQQCQPGKNLQSEIARVRGEAYTRFLHRAHELLSAHKIPLRYHLNMDHFRPSPPPERALAFPANLHFDWQRWIDERLIDEAVLRSYQHRAAMLTDPVGHDMASRCASAGIPISFNHHVFKDEPWYLHEAIRVANDGRFASIILYENFTFLRSDPDGNWRFTIPIAESICKAFNPPAQ